MSRVETVNRESHLCEIVSRISKAPCVAVDIESNGFFRYHERVCLVQLAAGQTAYLVDPLAIGDLRPLGDLLSNRSVEKVFHDAGYDVRSIDRDWGFRVNNLFDTSIAAAFVGAARLGLQSVVKDYADVELNKPARLQRSDWTKRPLSHEALRYAADDVLYLLRVRDVLRARLNRLSRLGWAKEEFARVESVRHISADPEMAYLSTKGSRDLDERGLAVLRSLWRLREREARRLDRAPFRVMPHSALVQLSSEPGINLSRVKGLGKFARPPADRRLKAAIEEGLRSQPLTRQKRGRVGEMLNQEERQRAMPRLGRLKSWRRQLSSELRLDPGLLWPTASLRRLARDPSKLDSEFLSPEIRNWQKRMFGRALREVLATLV